MKQTSVTVRAAKFDGQVREKPSGKFYGYGNADNLVREAMLRVSSLARGQEP